MADKEFLAGLIIRETEKNGECRAEIRMKESGEFVAWFYSRVRLSDRIPIVSVSAQVVRWDVLTQQQLAMIQTWITSRVQEIYANRRYQ